MKTVGLVGGSDAEFCLLSALAHSCGLDLRHARPHEAGSLVGRILLDPANGQGVVPHFSCLPSIRVVPTAPFSAASTIRFGADTHAPIPFRGRTLCTGSTVPGPPVGLLGEVIATADGLPVWTSISEAGVRHDTCWVSSPWIKQGDCVFDQLNGSRFLNLLPLLEWLRSISDWNAWQHPPLRACFLFDDPNLHATRYGFVNFAELAEAGRRQQYHTAFATVPLDGYYVNSAAARILRDNPETLSMLIHGNNHTHRELADRQATPSQQLALMQQAMLRIDRLEQRAAFPVSRVMAPPHGVCSAEMMKAMVDAGVEAVCVSHGSVWTGNPGAAWTVSLGTLPALVVSGLPVIPRFGLESQTENKALVAAYLHQPIIPVGHHWDLACGVDILSAAAQCINNLGNVSWSSMTAITRSNYRCRVEGHVLRVQTSARETAVDVPEDICELEVHAPWVDPVRETIVCRGSDRMAPAQADTKTGWRFSVTPGRRVDVVVKRSPANGMPSPALPRTPLNVIARKVLVELRDRGMPYWPRTLRRR